MSFLPVGSLRFMAFMDPGILLHLRRRRRRGFVNSACHGILRLQKRNKNIFKREGVKDIEKICMTHDDGMLRYSIYHPPLGFSPSHATIEIASSGQSWQAFQVHANSLSLFSSSKEVPLVSTYSSSRQSRVPCPRSLRAKKYQPKGEKPHPSNAPNLAIEFYRQRSTARVRGLLIITGSNGSDCE